MTKPLTITPSQTIGPFYAFCLTRAGYDSPILATGSLVTDDAVGERITIKGQVFDGNDAPVPDSMIEIWQADGEGRFAGYHPALKNSKFKGFGRTPCDDGGRFMIETVKPGRVLTRDGVLQAPHLALCIFGKGLNRHLYTRVYFDDENSNDTDQILSTLPTDLRPTMIAKSSSNQTYEIVIRLQGKCESVFFEA